MIAESRWLNDDTALIDLNFQGVSQVIAAYALRTEDGVALIECGPTTTVDALLRGLEQLGLDARDIRHILVTHIHLDHAGAAGVLLARLPDARFYVHEVGAPHSIDPAGLIRSASRIYGDQMEVLWGQIDPVPGDRVTVVRDGDAVQLDGRRLDVLYTPGHASHHVAYYDGRHNAIFTGDVAGVRIPPSSRAIPPTPPPDIDVEAWHESVRRLLDLHAESLLLTHFGEVTEVERHLREVEQHLDQMVGFVREQASAGHDRDTIVEQMAEYVHTMIGEGATDEVEQRFAMNVPYGMAVDGILRYLTKRGDLPGR